jgi:hypothetical protein
MPASNGCAHCSRIDHIYRELDPWFTPETQRSGFALDFYSKFYTVNRCSRATVLKKGSVSFEILLRYNVLFIVMACPIALCGLSGATTTIS